MTGFEPGFVSPLDNITAAAGRSAHFTCVVNNLGGHKVKFEFHMGSFINEVTILKGAVFLSAILNL